MAFEGALRLHRETRQGLHPLLRDISNWRADVSYGRWICRSRGRQRNVRVVSASSSFFRFILSFRASASRRAIWIFCWIDSALISAMLRGCYRWVERGGAWELGVERGEAGRIQGGPRRERGCRTPRRGWRQVSSRSNGEEGAQSRGNCSLGGG